MRNEDADAMHFHWGITNCVVIDVEERPRASAVRTFAQDNQATCSEGNEVLVRCTCTEIRPQLLSVRRLQSFLTEHRSGHPINSPKEEGE